MKSPLVFRIFRLGVILPALLYLSLHATPSFASEYDDLEVLKSDQEKVVFRYLVPNFSQSKIELQGKSFDLINIPKCGLSNIPGNPQLPVRKVLVAVPPEAELRVEVLEDEGTELPGIDLAFALKSEPDDGSPLGYLPVPMKPERVLDQYHPARIVSFDSPTFLRDQRIMELEISPIQYNPASKGIRYYSRITVKISFTGGRGGTFESEKDPFERIYRNVLLNYEESKGWRRAPRTRGFLKQPGTFYPFGFSDNWYKAIVRENGIYRIDRTMLMQAGAPVTSIDPRTLRIFSGGGKSLPLDSSHPFLEFEEMAILVSGEEDGEFDSDDFILFFGWSTNDWEYDTSRKAIDFHTNPYTDDNVFWLTFDPIPSLPDPKRMQIKDGSLVEQSPFVPSKFKSRVHAEQDNTLRKSSTGYVVDYFHWYWTEISSVQMFASLPGGLPQDTCLIKLKHTGSSPGLWVNGEPAEVLDSLSFGSLTVFRSFGFHGGLVDTLEISFSGSAFLDWYEIEYSRGFECHDRQLLFESPAISGVAQYEISNLLPSSQAYLFDLTDYFEVKKFEGLQIDGEFARFQDTVSADTMAKYLLVDENRIKKPTLFFRDESSNLREASNRADFLIITHSDFHDQAQSLKSFRESYNQMSVMAIKVQDVYDEFSGGLFDPTAIRDLLKFAYQNWEEPAPAFVLLLGDGNYDYKNNLGTGAVNFIPPFTADPSISDDLYVWWGDTLGMVISRLPVRSTEETEVVLEKIISYEKEPEFEPWRNSITLVADDEWEGPGELDGLWRFHTRDTEILAKSHIPASFDVTKVYLMEYPFDYKGEKPQAEDAVVNAFNSGTLIINFIGHGNPDVWAHERVFKRSQDIPRLTNKRKLPLVYTASCSIGFFFSPFSEGMAEEFLRAEDKGAVATISATWNVWPTPNAELNFKVYDLLLKGNSLSIGEALFVAKVLRGLDGNDRKYVLFGDPVMKLGAPRLKAELTEVTPDTLSALGLINVKGEVQDSEGTLITGFDGIAKITAFDSESKRAHEVPTQPPSTVPYDLPGLLMFKGAAKVEGGEFQASFVVPKDISYGGNTGRISVYVEGQDQDGVGVRDSLVIGGSDTTVIDTVGPEISLSFDGRVDFADGETILPNSILQLSISDQHGVNITGEVGHGITLVIDDDFQNQIDLTGSFEYDLGDYRRGSASHELPSLAEGDHVLSIKAWDNANNSSVLQANVKVSAQRKLELTEVMNYPNPFSDVTNFYYYLSQDADRVEIKIFTLAGRLIRQIPFASSRAGVNFSATWDGRDREGDEVANGVYIYKVTAEGVVNGERKMKESFGKAVVVR
ncbi:MAG: type IX secretion system sortase PorU [Candidatus Zixiibacteriota bacterium]